MAQLIRLADRRRQPRNVFFDRSELNQLLSLYSRQVIRGEWRDYAIDHRPGMAVFSIFRHSHDRPLFVIAKCGGGDRPADYLALSGKHKLKGGKSLREVLDVLDSKIKLRIIS